MKQILTGIMVISLYSCVAPTVTYVPIERQKENPYYVAPAVNSPLLFEKRDVVLNPGISFSDQRFGVDFMFAIKPFENIGFLVNYNIHAHGLNNSGGTGSEGRDFYFLNSKLELGTGYSKKLNDSWLLETFAGAAYGSLENDHATGHSAINQTSIFLEPAVGYRNATRKIEVGIALRLQTVNFDIDEVYFDQGVESHTTTQFQEIDKHPWQLMLEPGAFVRIGNNRVKFNMGVNYSQNLTFSEMDAKNFTASIGTTIKLNRGEKGKRGPMKKPFSR